MPFDDRTKHLLPARRKVRPKGSSNRRPSTLVLMVDRSAQSSHGLPMRRPDFGMAREVQPCMEMEMEMEWSGWLVWLGWAGLARRMA